LIDYQNGPRLTRRAASSDNLCRAFPKDRVADRVQLLEILLGIELYTNRAKAALAFLNSLQSRGPWKSLVALDRSSLTPRLLMPTKQWFAVREELIELLQEQAPSCYKRCKEDREPSDKIA